LISSMDSDSERRPKIVRRNFRRAVSVALYMINVALLAALLASSITASAMAQAVGGGITGVVHDPSGAAIPGGTVTIQSVETGAVRTLQTDEAGRYVAPSIAVGTYQLTAAKEGFNSDVKQGVEITVGQRTTVDFSLSLAGVQQQVTVSEEAVPV